MESGTSEENIIHFEIPGNTRQNDISFQVISESGSSKPQKLIFGFTKRHLLIFGFYGLCGIFRGVTTLIVGPFFPPEAEDKGASATEIGFVISALDFMSFLMSFVYGKKIIRKFGPQRVVNTCVCAIGICTIIFGCLDLIENRVTFIALCLVTRGILGAFDGGIYPSVFTMYSIEVPESISTAIGLFEIFFGIGAIVGPILCGMLVEEIGYTLMYVIVGSLLLASGVNLFIFAPKVNPELPEEVTTVIAKPNDDTDTISTNSGFIRLFQIPTVLLVIFSMSTASASIGFITATLELHYDELSPTMTGALFSSGTVIYTVLCPVWGHLSDKKYLEKSTILMLGAFFIIVGFSLLGPLPFIPYERATWAGFAGYAIHGIGIGGSIMTAYHHSLEAALAAGFPNDFRTYGLVSSLYTATFSLGNSIGPVVSGVLYDAIGFRWGTMFIIVLAVLVILAAAALRIFQRSRRT